MSHAKVIKLTFRLREVLPPGNPMSASLIRLMAATNDVRQLMTLLLGEEDKGIGLAPEQLIQNGEIGYLLRILCAHLFEAGTAFRNLESKCQHEIDGLLAHEPEAQKALAHLRMVYYDRSDGGLARVLEKVRNRLAFHYKHVPFEEALKRYEDEATLVLAEYAGMSRYAIADTFLTGLMMEEVGGTIEGFAGFHQLVLKLADALVTAVDYMLLRLLQERPSAILEQTEGLVEIPPGVRKTKERIERGRGQPIQPPGEGAGRRGTFLAIGRSLNLTGPPDWSSRLEDYLYGAAGNAG